MRFLFIMLFIILYLYFSKKECMSDYNRNIKSTEVFNKINIIKNNSYTYVKNKIPWMDSVVYYDLNKHINEKSTMADINYIIRPK